jgi:hypothetical protein
VRLSSVSAEAFRGDQEDAYAYYNPADRSLHFNVAAGLASDRLSLESSLSKDIAKGWHPEGHRGAGGLVAHEFAHALHDQKHAEVEAAVIDVLERTCIDGPRPQSHYWVQSDAGKMRVEDDVSRYANRNFNEFVAECCAEGRNNSGASELAKEVWRAVREQYV